MDIEDDWNFYLGIWKKRKHTCFETGQWLGKEPLTVFFHHVLPKKDYPEFRHKEWNIVLISFLTHDQEDRNPRLNPKIRQYEKEIKEKYI